MGRRGPVPAPVAVKRAKGETRPSRLNFDSPQPRHEPPKMPADMDDRAKAVWRHVLKAMEGTSVILAADADTLRIYCETMSLYQRYAPMLTSSTPLLTTSRRRGEVIRNPMLAIVRDLKDTMRLYARELGLTPSARASLRVDMTTPSAEMDAIIGPPPRLRAVQ